MWVIPHKTTNSRYPVCYFTCIVAIVYSIIQLKLFSRPALLIQSLIYENSKNIFDKKQSNLKKIQVCP